MMLKSGNKDAVLLDSNVFNALLSFYPEEKLHEHPILKASLERNCITFSELKDVCEMIHLPWQIFLLDLPYLKEELRNIENKRLDKFPRGVLEVHKRKGQGDTTSKRIIDRQIRIQNFVSSQLPDDFRCGFVGTIGDKNVQEAANYILEYFNININYFRARETAEQSKDYLIERIQCKENINVSQGVRVNGILPSIKCALDLYRNTSGFALKDRKIPFIFLPSEINPDENHYRQVYTLLYLVVVIGMDEFSHAIENYSIKKIREDKKFKKINDIVSEILLPKSFTENLARDKITKVLINQFKGDFKLSYSAILFILRTRKIIDGDLQENLKLPKREPSILLEELKSHFSTPKISTSVAKFCGSLAINTIIKSINTGLFPNQAQMLIFGRFRKSKWLEFISQI